MKKTTVRILSLLMCLILCLSLMPAAFASTIKQTKVTGSFRYNNARSMLSLINDFRTGSDAWYWNDDSKTSKTEYNKSGKTYLGTLTYDYSLEKIAMQRARELVVSFSHTRPNGQDCWSLKADGIQSWGENIAYGYGSTESVFIAWREDNDGYSGQGHRRNMLREGYTAVGVGCFSYNGCLYWVQEFGYSNSGTAATAANENEVVGYVEYDSDEINWKDEDAPSIVSQTMALSVTAGDKAEFSVTASGDGLSYQWQFRRSASGDWINSGATGAKTNKLTVTTLASYNGYQYRCIVTNSKGTAISNPATLTVTSCGPSITAQPKSLTASAGGTAKFSVTASGSGLSYQWQFRRSSSGSWENSGATGAKTSALTVTVGSGYNGYQYRCVVKNSGGTAYSNVATLTVSGAKPVITSQPQSQTASPGGTAKFSVGAVGTNVSYQWQFRRSSSGSWENSGATGAKTSALTVTVGSGYNGYQYRCIVKNSAGSATSGTATLTVNNSKPVIATQPSSRCAYAGMQIQFSVAATGANLSYQWQFRRSSTGSWENSGATGAKSDTLTVGVSGSYDGYQYRCIVKNGVGSVTSDTAKLTVLHDVYIYSWTSSVTTCAGCKATFSVTAYGEGLTYQWQFRRGSSGNWQNSGASGAKTKALTVTTIAGYDGYQYRCIVTDKYGNTETSSPATLHIN